MCTDILRDAGYIRMLGDPHSDRWDFGDGEILFGGSGGDRDRGAHVVRSQGRKTADDIALSGTFCETRQHGSKGDSRSTYDGFAPANLRIA
jgi:hypothetical protein